VPGDLGIRLRREALDKSEGGVKDKSILSVFLAPFFSREVEDQDSGNLTLNHPTVEIVPPTIDSA
jgi:hypothetical protein